MISEPRQRVTSPLRGMASDDLRRSPSAGSRPPSASPGRASMSTAGAGAAALGKGAASGADSGLFHRLIGLDAEDREEIAETWVLGREIFGNCSLSETLAPVSIMFIGRLGATELGAAVLGMMWVNCSGVALLGGMAGALDTQCSHAHGAGMHSLVGLHFLRGCAVLTVLCALVLVAWVSYSRVVLEFLADGDVEQVDKALPLVWWSSIGLWPSVMYRAASKWLQAQGRPRGPLVASAAGAVVNPVLNYLLVFRLDGGLAGAAVANSLAWVVMLVVLTGHTLRRGLHKKTLPRAVPVSELLVGWGDFLRLGIPAAAIMCFEWWSWELTNVIASRIGRLELAVHGVMLNIGNLYYILVPMSISQAAAVRVGTLLGEGNSKRAARSSWLLIRLTAYLMLAVAALIKLFPVTLGAINTTDPDVLAALPTPMTAMALFAVFDSTSVVIQGILRGAGEQKMGAVGSLVGYYGVAQPAGWLLSRHGGLLGLWHGMTLGCFAALVFNLSVYLLIDWKKIKPTSREGPVIL